MSLNTLSCRETSQPDNEGNIAKHELGANGTFYIVEYKSLDLKFIKYYQGGEMKVYTPLPAKKEWLSESIQGEGSPGQSWF